MMLVVSVPLHVTLADWGSILPELVVTGGFLVLLLADAFIPVRRTEVATGIALLTILLAFLAAMNLWPHGMAASLYDTVSSDKFAVFFDFVILVSAALTALLSPSYIRYSHFDPGEFYALILASAVGMMFMAAAISLMVIFIALELLSLALYILSGFERSRPESQEAGFKYFLLSSFASAFLVYGMAMVYGATGTTRILQIATCLGHGAGCSAAASASPLLYIGVGLMLVGFAFKVSIVLFHMWTPDVYQGAPTPVTAFMSVTTKAAVFAAFIRVFNFALAPIESHWYGVVWALAIVTMVVGNIVALVQTSMKRLLAYSGIAHAGYILVALAADNALGQTSVAFYFLAYAFMNIGAFVVVAVMESQEGPVGDEIASYRGLFYRNPSLAGATAVFMFSLAGFPLTAGFVAKYLAFSAAVQAHHTDLAIIGVLTSLISIYYYLRVVYVMLRRPEVPGVQSPPTPAAADLAAWIAVAGTIGLGIIPTGFLNLATQSVTAIRYIFGLP